MQFHFFQDRPVVRIGHDGDRAIVLARSSIESTNIDLLDCLLNVTFGLAVLEWIELAATEQLVQSGVLPPAEGDLDCLEEKAIRHVPSDGES